MENFLIYFASCITIFLASVYIYTAITPYKEFEMIHKGNSSAAYSLAGALLGIGLVIASLAAHAANLWQLLIWSCIVLCVQLMVYFGFSLVFNGLRRSIEQGNVAAGITLGCFSAVTGAIHAACLT